MKTPLVRRIIQGIGSLILLAACVPSAAPPTAPPPAPTPTPIALYAVSTHEVAHRRTPRFIPSPSPARQPTPSPTVCPSESEETSLSPAYNIVAELDFATKTVTAEQAITYRNDTGTTLSDLVFHVPPNNQPGVFTLNGLSLGGEAPPSLATLEGVRLTVPLDPPLLPGCQLQVDISYTLNLLPMGTGYFPRQGYLGYSPRQLNLGHWTPVLAFYDEGAWMTPIPINIGEQGIISAAAFEVTLTVLNPPDNLTVVGPGNSHRRGSTWHFELAPARDLVLSLSDAYHQLVAETPNGYQVELYILDEAPPQPESEHPNSAPDLALDTAATALELFADLYGEYPYERLVVIQGDFPDGMEFSGLVFVGGEWFRSYDGDPASYLNLITAHEVSHQWWYNIVANDQANAPWLDEALATYSEYVFLEENYPNLTDWWWDFRVNAWSPEGYVDASVYQFETLRGYINAVYLQGARLMHALRQDLGGEAFFQWLHDYVAAMRGQVATPQDLWAALTPEQYDATHATRAAYLRDPGPDR